ncbi:MAG: alpha/beta hydrolase, partial [Fibrobacterota bacterium]
MKTDLFALAEEIARHESEIGDIRPGAEKHLVLNGGGERTQFSFVYVHGFTASRRETAPLADRVAARFGGNLFYTRLRGHGRRPESMAEVTLDDWYQDV